MGPDGRPDPVPVTFAVDGEAVYTAIDHKPKTTRHLQRLRNIEREPAVTLLVHGYSENWADLWWCRLDGTATIEPGGPELDRARHLLEAKYDQYKGRPPEGPAIVIRVTDRTGWRA